MVLRPQRGLSAFLLGPWRLSSEAAHEEQRDNCAHHRRVIAHYEHGPQNPEAELMINHRGGHFEEDSLRAIFWTSFYQSAMQIGFPGKVKSGMPLLLLLGVVLSGIRRRFFEKTP